MSTSIEWTQGDDGAKGETWNPTLGCSDASEGCRNCYAKREAYRKPFLPNPKIRDAYVGLTKKSERGRIQWTGKLRLMPDRLGAPLRWRRARRIFVNSMSDLFHEELANDDIDRVFATMLACEAFEPAFGHVFQILTKRAERMREYFAADPSELVRRWALAGDRHIHCDNEDVRFSEYIEEQTSRAWTVDGRAASEHKPWGFVDPLFPLRNAWLGVSVEDRRDGLPRIDELRSVPAVVRFLSIEPLLEDLGELDLRGIQWVIAGAESGPGARPARVEWFRSIRDQCVAANVPFFLKQFAVNGRKQPTPELDGQRWMQFPRVGPVVSTQPAEVHP
jgi:protein gp37